MTTEETKPDKGPCPYCGKRKRKGLQEHITRRHADGKVTERHRAKPKISKSQENKFGDLDPKVCRFCGKRKRTEAAVKKHEDKRHYEEAHGLPPKPVKPKKLNRFDRKAETPGIFRAIITFDAHCIGYREAKQIFSREKVAELAKAFGEGTVDHWGITDIRMLDWDFDEEDPHIQQHPDVGEEPMIVEEGEGDDNADEGGTEDSDE